MCRKVAMESTKRIVTKILSDLDRVQKGVAVKKARAESAVAEYGRFVPHIQESAIAGGGNVAPAFPSRTIQRRPHLFLAVCHSANGTLSALVRAPRRAISGAEPLSHPAVPPLPATRITVNDISPVA
jgi:hypothetical protein